MEQIFHNIEYRQIYPSLHKTQHLKCSRLEEDDGDPYSSTPRYTYIHTITYCTVYE